MMFGQHLAICTVFHKESESEVKQCKNFGARREKLRKTNVKLMFFLHFFCFLDVTFLNLNVGLQALKRAQQTTQSSYCRKNIC